MKYEIIKEILNKDSVEKLLGKKIKSLTVGILESGANGIEVEIDDELSTSDIKKLNGLVNNQIDVLARIDTINVEIERLQDKKQDKIIQ